MSKRTRILAAVMATMTITTALVGCGKKEEGDGGKNSKETLTVWSHLSTNEIDNVVRPLAEEWGKENDVEVKVIEDKADMQDAITACKTSKGPDLYFGLAHDNLGTAQKAGVLAEVKSGIIDKSKYTAENVVDAVTIEGKQWAVPIAQEAIVLFYNKDMVPEAPKTMEEVISIGKEKGFMFDATDFYLDFFLLSANGGYVFKEDNGSLDPTDVGLGNDGAKKGYETIKTMLDEKLFAADINNDIAKSQFTEGKSAFYISGAWSIADCEKANINFGIATLPSIDGGEAKPFLGVQSAFVNANSKKQDKAWELLEYLTEKSPEDLIKEGSRLPVLKSAQDGEAYKANKYFEVFAKQTEVAIPMPNIPEVQTMWDPAKNNIIALMNGTQSVDETAAKVVEQIKEGIEQQK